VSIGCRNSIFPIGKAMNVNHSGTCLCGEVRYTVHGVFERFYLCHCSHCRKDTGSAHAANLFSSSAKLTWHSGEASITTFQLAGTRHVRSFCAKCGSPVPFADTHMLVVPAGGLDTDPRILPDGHIFAGSRATWDRDLHEARWYDALPT